MLRRRTTALLLAHTTLVRSLSLGVAPRASSPFMTEAAVRRVLVPVADDSEEIETACITDTLVRAGAKVVVASVMPSLQVRMSRGLKVVADCSIEECKGQDWDAIACPGGMPGAERLRDSATLTELLKSQAAAGKLTTSVCAAPAIIFATHGILPSKATCCALRPPPQRRTMRPPGLVLTQMPCQPPNCPIVRLADPAPAFKEAVQASSSWEDSTVVVEGNIITSQGPGTSLQFALKMVEALYGEEKAKEIASQMLTTVA